ncbi:sporulation protein [Corallococcus sicarius]|uniref:Sporulation protein SpoOM n=1 Tax=Corallococcus sicarius TaxID=2316726 RepID=A0A3A8NN50_9BACT|nr:sporulation protein [Corallococcus sicarius]RKH43591.1 sporulation protein SpoOM [Corallococcus sicarius]
MPLKTMLARVGVGSARVDTRLEHDTVRAGGELRGAVHIQGGQTPQRIDRVELHLMAQYLQRDNDRLSALNAVVRTWRIANPFTVEPREEKVLPFALRLPVHTPITERGAPVWLKTALDIDHALNPEDSDRLHVLPHPSLQTVIDAALHLGLQWRNAYCEAGPPLGRDEPFVQELEFHTGPMWQGPPRTLALLPFPREDGLELILDIDRGPRGLTSLLEGLGLEGGRRQRCFLSQADLSRGVGSVAEVLASHLASGA